MTRVEHQRDARHRLHGAVVEEEREPAPLLLLGGDQLIGEPRVLGLEPVDLLAHPFVLWRSVRSSVAPEAVTANASPEQRQPVQLSAMPITPDGAGDDQRDERPGSSR